MISRTAAQGTPGMGPGVLAVVQDDLPVDDDVFNSLAISAGVFP